MRRLVALLALPILLNACAGALVSGATQTGIAVAENRSIGRKVDDTVLYTDLTNQFMQADRAELLGSVTFNVRFARVMLTGNVKSEEDAHKAVELSWKAKNVAEVINELVVNPEGSLITTAGDVLAKRNLEGRLLVTKGVWVINYSIDVTNGTAYFIGRVKDKAELDRVFSIARTTKGIKRVVSHLQINADTERPTAAPGVAIDSTAATARSASPTHAAQDAPEIYTGPVYGSGSINSAPIDEPK